MVQVWGARKAPPASAEASASAKASADVSAGRRLAPLDWRSPARPGQAGLAPRRHPGCKGRKSLAGFEQPRMDTDEHGGGPLRLAARSPARPGQAGLAPRGRPESRKRTSLTGCDETEIEELRWESGRDWERPTRNRIADGYSIVKSKMSIRNDSHSSKRRKRNQSRRRKAPPFSAAAGKGWGTLKARATPPAESFRIRCNQLEQH